MIIETKYDVGQRVWVILDDEVKYFPILGIHIIAEGGVTTVRYKLSDRNIIDGKRFFNTKEELIKSL